MVKNVSNSIINTVGAANAGRTNTLFVQNPDNANTASHATANIVNGGAASGHVWTQYTIGNSRSYAFGVNNAASQALQINTSINQNVNPNSGTNLWKMTTAGIRTLPLQPCFSVFVSADVPNFCGDNNDYTVPFNTKNFDTQNSYNTGTYTFTAPVTGKYLLNCRIQMTNISNNHNVGDLYFKVNGAYVPSLGICNPTATQLGNGFAPLTVTGILGLNAGDTILTEVIVQNGTKTITLIGGWQQNSFEMFMLG